MSGEATFLRKARREVEKLLETPLSGADAYRALVLLARLRDASSPNNMKMPTAPVEDLLRACMLPTASALLSDLAVALEGEDDPVGAVHDALLDIDDLMGALIWAGNDAACKLLATQALTLTQKHPERLSPLFGWADMRRSTLSPHTTAWGFWDGVLRLRPCSLQPVSLPDLPLAAAHTPREEDLPLAGGGGSSAATLYLDPETHERKLDVELPSRDTKSPASVRLFALRRGTREPLGSERLAFEREGRDLHISLGPDVGPQSARHRLCNKLGVDIAETIFEVRFDDES